MRSHRSAFTDRVFAGNPAAVCPWTDGSTTTCSRHRGRKSLRNRLPGAGGGGGRLSPALVTPTVEVDLCITTLASSHYLLTGSCADRA